MKSVISICSLAGVVALRGPDERATHADGAFPPHRIVGNVYYVGTKNLASFLITTNRGHLLINSGFDHTVPRIRESVEKLGFRFEDIEILLTNHAHSDHVGGHALVKRLTGARVLVMTGDDEAVRSGGKDEVHEGRGWEPSPVDQVLHDGDEVKLGGVVLVARHTPGHTKGTTSWSFPVKEGDSTYHVLVLGGGLNPGTKLVGNARYPDIAEDFAKTLEILKQIPCDVPLGPHGNYFALEAKYAKRAADSTRNPYIDPERFRRGGAILAKMFHEELARQKAAPPN